MTVSPMSSVSQEERRSIARAFVMRLVVSLIIVVFGAVQLIPAIVVGDLWLTVAGLLAGLFLFATAPLMVGEYPFFSDRTDRIVLWLAPPVSVLLYAGVTTALWLLRAVFPITFAEGTTVVSYAIRIMPASFLLGQIAVLVRLILGRIRQVEIMTPKWISLRSRTIGIHPLWAVSSPNLMRRLRGVPMAIINRSNRTVVLTMIWLEWFTSLRVSKSFHREFTLRHLFSSESRTYQRKMIELDDIRLLKPKDSFTWVLSWNEARKFYDELLRKRLIEYWEEVSIRVSLYDEYADRVCGSREMLIRAVLGEERFLQTGS